MGIFPPCLTQWTRGSVLSPGQMVPGGFTHFPGHWATLRLQPAEATKGSLKGPQGSLTRIPQPRTDTPGHSAPKVARLGHRAHKLKRVTWKSAAPEALQRECVEGTKTAEPGWGAPGISTLPLTLLNPRKSIFVPYLRSASRSSNQH